LNIPTSMINAVRYVYGWYGITPQCITGVSLYFYLHFLYKGNAQKLQENRAQNLKRQFILKRAPSSSSFNSPLPFLPPRFRWSFTFRYRRTYFCSCRWFSLCFSCTVSSSTSTVFSRSITYTTTPRTYTCRHFIVVVCFATRYDLTFSRPRSEGWPHHGRTFSIYPWLTLSRRVLSTSWCCPSRPSFTKRITSCMRHQNS